MRYRRLGEIYHVNGSEHSVLYCRTEFLPKLIYKFKYFETQIDWSTNWGKLVLYNAHTTLKYMNKT